MRSTRGAAEPDWPTTVRARKRDGRVQGTDGSVWLYRSVPLAPVADAPDEVTGLEPGGPILAALDELAAMTGSRITAAQRREERLPAGAPAAGERAPPVHPRPSPAGAAHLAGMFPDTAVQRRLLLFGVRLRDRITGAGWRGAVDSAVETLVSGTVPLSDFDADYTDVDQALTRAGLATPSDERLPAGRGVVERRPVRRHPDAAARDHLHVFTSVSAAHAADQAGPADCTDWPEIPGQHAVTFAAVEQFDLGDTPATTVRPAGRSPGHRRRAGRVHPGTGGTGEDHPRGAAAPAPAVPAGRHRAAPGGEDVRRAAGGDPGRARVHRGRLRAGWAAHPGRFHGARRPQRPVRRCRRGRRGQRRHSERMPYRQEAAFAETWLCSPVRAVPHLHDLPSHTVAYSGLPSLSSVGDPDGALLGFTEKDRQPAYLSPTAAAANDGLPVCGVFGQTGSGKTIAMLYLADQFARTGHPQVIFDPKPLSDHTAAVLASGGRVASLDELIHADGVLDPLRFAHTPDLGVEEAANMLLSVNPWGSRGGDVYPGLMKALRIGVQDGATCIGQALRTAADHGVPREVTDPVFELAGASPLFRAMVGMDPDTETLRVADGITLIKVGRTRLELPAPGTPRSEMTPPQRVSASLIRMITLGSMSALAERDGVMHLDEAWVVLGAGVAEMDAIGRTARSLRVLPILYTQKCTDALRAGLAGYISRILILPMQDEQEARAACGLARLEPTSDRIRRITAKARTGNAPNWDSMRALRDPGTGETLRGAVASTATWPGGPCPPRSPSQQRFSRSHPPTPATSTAGCERRSQSGERDRTECQARQLSYAYPAAPW